MERNPGSSSGLEWKNLGKPIEITQELGFSMYQGNEFGAASQESSKETLNGYGKVNFLPPYKNTYDDIIRMQWGSASSSEPMIGLGLGRQKGYGETCFPAPKTSIPVSPTPTKRSRASYQNMQNPCCQVEGCNLDLKSAKDYHRRHRICETHSKSPKVTVAGMERRFCQQCSRFHDLSEFDDKKRSCRRRLSDHNARRRRVQPESIQLGSSGLSSASYEQRQQNVLLNGLPISLSNPTWENGSSSISRQALIRPSKYATDEIHNSISNLHMDSQRLSSIQSSNPRALDQCIQVPTTNSWIAPDLLTARSLLSSNDWSLNEGESTTSMEGLVHGNFNPVMRNSDSETNYLSLFQPNNIQQEVHSVNLQNPGSSHHQEYQLFKTPYDSGGFYSTQRNL